MSINGRHKPGYHFILPVWGPTYIQPFLEYGLATQLSVNNLQRLAYRGDLSYGIYTRPGDIEAIRQSPAFQKLRDLLPTHIFGDPGIDFDTPDPYETCSACYRAGIRQARLTNANPVFLTADQLWADGALSAVIGLGDTGKTAIMIAGPRVLDKAAQSALRKFKGNSEDPALTITPRALVALTLECLHPWDRSLFWDANDRGRPASFAFWEVPNEGYLMRCFHLHPVLLKGNRIHTGFKHTIDGGDFVQRNAPNPEAVHIVEDSDEVMYCAMAPGSQSRELINKPKVGWQGVQSWTLSSGLTRHHIVYARKKFKFHHGDMTAAWDRIAKNSDRVLSPVIERLSKNKTLLFYRILKRCHDTLGRPFQRRNPLSKFFKKCIGIGEF